MGLSPEFKHYDQLVHDIYRGAIEHPPWSSTLPALRVALDARVVSLVLRPPTAGDPGIILNSVKPESVDGPGDASLADPEDWQVTAYREEFFSLDPFINLPLDQLVSLDELISDKALIESDYYKHYLEPVGLFRILGIDIGEPSGLIARLRVSRERNAPNFDNTARETLSLIAPHLRQALAIYARLHQTQSERNIYAGAVDQLSVATFIFDEQGQLIANNAMATALLKRRDGLTLRDSRLHLASRESDRALQHALAGIIAAQLAGETAVVKALRVPRQPGQSDMGLVVRPVPLSDWGEGGSGPCAAVFISDPDEGESASQKTLAELYDLTPAEANVAILLTRGLSLAEVASAQNISPNTARAQLKAVFAKTGVSRQAELVRMLIKSVAALG